MALGICYCRVLRVGDFLMREVPELFRARARRCVLDFFCFGQPTPPIRAFIQLGSLISQLGSLVK